MSEVKTPDSDMAGDNGSGKETHQDLSGSSEKTDETVPELNGKEKEETEEYPKGFVFAMIMTSVLSSLFLVALVILMFITHCPVLKLINLSRTELSSLPPSLS